MQALFYPILMFWLAVVLQASLLAAWAPDLIFLTIFGWGLYKAVPKSGTKIEAWAIFLPVFVGISLASALFFSFLGALPYFLTLVVFVVLIVQRSKWLFRYKEGFFSYLLIFLVFALSIVFIRAYIINYVLTGSIVVRFLLTFVLGLCGWFYFVAAGRKGKIR